MAIRIVRLGSRRKRGEGVRLGTVRRPPRGVPRARYAADDWFDVWLPNLSPSAQMMKDREAWQPFARRFKAEMSRPEASRLLDALAALSRTANFSLGCYCADESRCHRSVLRELLLQRGAEVR
jgi:uncharacterized protein YeaO (DUF488 family)